MHVSSARKQAFAQKCANLQIYSANFGAEIRIMHNK